MSKNKGFTLIELLVVVAIIGVLATIVLASLASARTRALDAQTRTALGELVKANELYYADNNSYPITSGWINDPDPLLVTLAPYISDPLRERPTTGNPPYQYWRKDHTTCAGGSPDDEKFAYYARLEEPNDADAATFSDPFDICIRDTYSMNYKVGLAD